MSRILKPSDRQFTAALNAIFAVPFDSNVVRIKDEFTFVEFVNQFVVKVLYRDSDGDIVSYHPDGKDWPCGGFETDDEYWDFEPEGGDIFHLDREGRTMGWNDPLRWDQRVGRMIFHCPKGAAELWDVVTEAVSDGLTGDCISLDEYFDHRSGAYDIQTTYEQQTCNEIHDVMPLSETQDIVPVDSSIEQVASYLAAYGIKGFMIYQPKGETCFCTCFDGEDCIRDHATIGDLMAWIKGQKRRSNQPKHAGKTASQAA